MSSHEPSLPALFVFDVDGTLLTRAHEILPSTRAGVAALVRTGHRVALASARPPRSVAELSHDLLGRDAPIVALNGAFVADGRERLLERAIAPETARELTARARDAGLAVNLFAGWSWWVDALGPEVEAEAAIVGFDPDAVGDLDARLGDGAHKALLIGSPERIRAFRDAVAASELPVEVALSKPTYCEVVARGVSKAGAVGFLAQRLGVPAERVIAFGDGENDLPMLRAAGTGVAMGNATAEVRAAADLVTDDHDADGIARALERLGYLDG